MDEKDKPRPSRFDNESSPPGSERFDGGRRDPRSRAEQDSSSGPLVRLFKQVQFATERGKHVDHSVVSPKFYNCFNYSLLPKEQAEIHLTVGVTSPNPGEGKTIVASNLAVSLAIANQFETVLVDLNLHSPRIHSIFGTKLGPGVVGAFSGTTIQVFLTQIEHLYVLPAGNLVSGSLLDERISSHERDSTGTSRPSIGLDHVVEFRNILYSLKKEFDFVIVDMPFIHEPRVPTLLTHQMDGVLVVVDVNKTKHHDIERLFTKVNENRILGFVMNRVAPS